MFDATGTPAEHYPVVICGGGPTGLALSALLGKYGVASALFECRPDLPQHPQAHYINNRTMEVRCLSLAFDGTGSADLNDLRNSMHEVAMRNA